VAVKIVDNSSKFIKEAEKQINLVLASITTDIYRLSQAQVPVSEGGGHLQSSGQIVPGHLKYSIKYNKEYASYQHRGMRRDGTHVVRNYTYPGKKAHFLSDPADTIMRNKESYLKRHIK